MALSRKKVESVSVDLFQIQAAAGVLAKYADRVFESEMDLSQSQLAVLLIIDSLKPPVNQSRVAERIQRGLNSTSMMIDRLKKLGLVTRTRSKSDRRENYLELTQAGRDKVTKGKKLNTLVARRLTSVLTDKDARDLSTILNKLEEQAIKEMGENGRP
jgi:MarR family transcriptional regulator, organic hydroperoxide resistance regulator